MGLSVSDENNMIINKRLFIVLAIAICVVHVAIRAYDLDRESFDFDESMTWTHVLSVKGVFAQITLDVHPPLYFLGLSLWRQLAGSSEIALRAPSVVFSLLTLVTLMAFAYSIHIEARRINALIVGILFCFLPYDIFLSRFARSWTMTVFLCTLHSFLYLRAANKSETRPFVWSCAVGLLAVYTHYIAILSVLGTMGAATLASPSRRNVISAGISLAAIGAMFVPWALVLPIQMIVKAACPHFTNIWHSSAETFLGPISPGPYNPDVSCIRSGPLYLMGLGVSLAAIGIILAHIKRLIKVYWTRALLMQEFFLIVLLTLSPTPLFNGKTLCVLLPPILILLAFCLSDSCLTKKRLPLIASVGFIFIFCAVSLAGFPYPSGRSGWREVCRSITAILPRLERPIVLLSHTEEILPLQYQQSRGEGTHINEVCVPLNSVGILLHPYDKELRLRIGDNPPPESILDARRGPVSAEGVVWFVNYLLETNPDISDILYIRTGCGDLFGQSVPGPVNLLHLTGRARFTLYRIGRFSEQVVYQIKPFYASGSMNSYQ
jgi:hypothetical protein